METPEAYIPIDRRLALAQQQDLPDRTTGAALFADISGFTPLTEALVRALGPQRGAEELPRQLNLIYDALIAEVDRYGGSVIGFSGDAITCWFDRDDASRATACALAMQSAMQQFHAVPIPGNGTASLAIKVAVATGPARRFLVGDPAIQLIDVLAGETLERLAATEHRAAKGEVVLDPQAGLQLASQVAVVERRIDGETGAWYAVVSGLATDVAPRPWPSLPPDALGDEQIRAWLLPPVYERLRSGLGEFLTELRPAVPLFQRFGGIDYDGDPDAGAKLDAYIRWVQRVLVRYGGFLIQLTVGDKGSYLYAAFGAPLAHDDDASRAIAAALDLRVPPPDMNFVGGVQIGISRGRMRTGAYGGSTRRTYGVLGDHVNLAARLMQHAPMGEVLVGHVAQKAAAEDFTWEELPPLRVKGKSAPVTVFRAVGLKERGAVHLQEPRYTLPMVGRKAELALVEEKLAQVLSRHGQILAITGEAGMGKSRLVAEIIRLASERRLAGYAGECQSYGTHNSYLVWESIWQTFFGVDAARPPDEQIRILEAQLAAIDPLLVPRLPLLGMVLNLPIPDNDLTGSLDAKLRKASLEALLVDCLRARAQAGDRGGLPLLLVLEDCHWLDPLSHDLLEAIGRAITDLPVLIVIAYRPPELEHLQAPRVTQLPHCTIVRLTDFTPEEAAQLIALKLAQLAGSEAELPPALVERITARAQGNPFYIEELLNYLRDQGIDPGDTRALEHLDLPTSLHSLILSRIDQLSENQKITLKVASIIGRLFQFRWLWGVHPQLGESQRVKEDLNALSRLDLTPLDQPEPELTYLFKHILTREVAYESLPYATRELLHGQLGQFIEQTYRDIVEQHLDLLAHHYWHSRDDDKKREYLRRAGEAAQAAYANSTAIDYFQRVLPLLPIQDRVAVMLMLGQVLELVGEWGDASDLYREALGLAEQLNDYQELARCQSAMGELLRKQGEYVEASAMLERARFGFEQLGDQAGIAQVLKTAGTVAALQGDFVLASDLYRDSLAIWREVGNQAGIANTLNNVAVVAEWQGDFETARSLNEESLAIRRALGDKPGICTSLDNLGTVLRAQGDLAAARALSEEGLMSAREVGDRQGVASALVLLGRLARDEGNYPAARAIYEDALTILRQLGDSNRIALTLNNMGNAALDEGDYAAARGLHLESLAIRRELGDKRAIAMSLNNLGNVARDEGNYESARALYDESMAISQGLGDRQAIAYLLEDLGCLAAAQSQSERALRLAGAAATLRETIGAHLAPPEHAKIERMLEPARHALGKAASSAAWEAGRAMTLELAIEYALGEQAYA